MTVRLRPNITAVVELAQRLRGSISAAWQAEDAASPLRAIHQWIESATGNSLAEDAFADLYAQTIANAATAIALRRDVFCTGTVRRWLLSGAEPLWQRIWSDGISLVERGALADGRTIGAADLADRLVEVAGGDDGDDGTGCGRSAASCDSLLYAYEAFLEVHDARSRTRHGVFFTPRPVARYIVQQVDRVLRHEFQLADGLADTSTWQQWQARHGSSAAPDAGHGPLPFVRVLDPALGSGVFLVEVIDRVHRCMMARWTEWGLPASRIARLWNDYVPRHLLPRLCGLELLLPACVVAQAALVAKLSETGFHFRNPATLQIHLADTLAAPARPARLSAPEPVQTRDAPDRAGRAWDREPFTVVVGNPPFSGISRRARRWIARLLRGQTDARSDWADYYQVDGRPLGERKVWLQDDYVKFMRYAHWKIECAGCGVVGLLTNHGYLDNPTFRGMRQQLMKTFPRITVVDLHGNRKKKERTPDGGADENVFAIDAGTAIGLFRRLPSGEPTGEVHHAELWGRASEKLDRLRAAASGADRGRGQPIGHPTPLAPASPNYFFVPRQDAAASEYERGYRLPDIMPVGVTAPVTARDRFVVAFQRDELLARMQEFRDLDVADDVLRRRYFTYSRSNRYAPGDTRGWRLADARRRVAADPHWRDRIAPCWYRPFDRRVVYWAEWMIDWPRNEVMRHMQAGENLALVARRQMLPSQPCNYFWIADGLALDGLIRSDNRGSESLFPLYLYPRAADAVGERRPNYTDAFVRQARRVLRMRWTADGCGDAQSSFGPEDLACYSYALFFSATYRQRYADLLRSDFPRVFLPQRPSLFAALRRWGARLADHHLLRVPPDTTPEQLDEPGFEDGWRVEAGFPKYSDRSVWVSQRVGFQHVPQEVWDFHAGGHQACRKWLKDRRGRSLDRADAQTYRRILAAVAGTLDCIDQIDRAIRDHGGWPGAFSL